MKQHMGAWGVRVFSLAILGLAVWKWGMPLYARYLTPTDPASLVPAMRASEGEFVVSFREKGELRAGKSVRVVSVTSGKIITLVKEGSVVSAGTLIAELDTSDLQRDMRDRELRVQNQMASVQRYKAELQMLVDANKTEVEQAQKQLDFDTIQLTGVAKRSVELAQNELAIAEAELAKTRRLVEKKLVQGSRMRQAEALVRSRNSSLLSEQARFESRKMAVTRSTAQLALRMRQCEVREKQKEDDIRDAEYQLALAQQDLDDRKTRFTGSTITAPAAGMVVLGTTRGASGEREPFREGSMVRRRQTVCELPDLGSIEVQVQLGEADVPKVSPDMPCLIRLDAAPGKLFHGAVADIANLASAESIGRGQVSDKKYILVKIALKEKDPKTLKPGLSAEVEFVRETIRKAISVPMECVIEQDGKTFVYVKSGKVWDRRQVTVGTRNEDEVVVTKGLKKGELVALRDPTKPLEDEESGDEAANNAGIGEPVPIPGQ